MKEMKIVFFIIILIVFSLFSLNKSDDSVFTANDLQTLNRLSSPALSTNGEYVVFSVKKWTPDGASTHLEYSKIAEGKTFILRENDKKIHHTNPTFAGDYLFFLSNESGSTQIWYSKFPPKDGEEVKITKLSNYPIEIDNLKVSGSIISFSAEVYFECSQGNFLECSALKDKEVESRGSNTWGVYNRLMMRHWDRWLTEGKGNHIFAQRFKIVDNIPTLDGEATDILYGIEANSPVPPFGGLELFDISKDGTKIVFTALERNSKEAWNTGWKIFTVNFADSTKPEHLTKNIEARTQNPRFSPDATKISYLSMKRPGLESDNLHLEIYDTFTRRINKIDFLDRSIIDYAWVNGKTIVFTCTDLGVNKVYQVDIDNTRESLTSLTDDKYSYSNPIPLPDGRIIMSRSSFTTSENLVILNIDYNSRKLKEIINLTEFNKDTIAKFKFDEGEKFIFKGGYDDDVQGWIIKPKDFNPDKLYPLAYLIHGGPEGAWESAWSYRWNPQIWANAGYVVVMINPHGSSGMGIKFQDAVRDDWGGIPYEDLMVGLDFALDKFKFIDKQRMCALGASYGGYMVNWIQGHTDRFKCLVTHDGVFSTVSMFYATEELWFPYAEYCPRNGIGCQPFDKKFRERYQKFSPEEYVDNWQTPHLVIHGSNDFRIPISEGISVFSALQVKGIESRFLHFTQENHWVLKPENSIKWYSEVIGWLDNHTKK